MKNKFVKTFVLPVLLLLVSITAYTQQNKPVAAKQTNTPPAKYQKMPTVSPEVLARPFDYNEFLKKEKAGLIPSQAGPVVQDKSARMPVKREGERNPLALSTPDVLVNNNAGATGTGNFTQSETSITAFGNNVVIAFNDAGSNAGGANKFTGWSRSTDGGATFTDGGSLPTSAGGDAGDPILARNNTTGRIYFSTLGFSVPTIQMWRSDDNGATWLPPVNATPGGASEDKQWHAVDNFAGAGNGNVYLLSRNFGAGNGIYCYRSTDNGNTFGPTGGVQIVSGFQGAFVAVGPDHAVYAFWYAGATIQMRKSTDFGVTFAPAITVASGLLGGTNGDLALTGQRQGVATFNPFRSNEFPHVAINPVSGNIYTVFANNPAGADKADVFLVQSNNGGTTWSAPVRVNDDATTTDQWQPTIAVTPDGANVGVFYYSRQEDVANNNLYRFYGRTGIAGATITFLPSFAISDVPSLPEFGRDAVINAVYMGDYDYAVATPGKFHVVWSDCRLDLTGGAGRKDPNVFYKSIDAAALVGPNINVSPANVDFGNVAVSQTGNRTITITNTGDAPLTVSAISAPGGVFTLSGLPALPAVIPSLGTVTFTASFTPTALGVQNANFTITSNAVNTPSVTVNLTGTGVTNISVSPLTVNFGDVPVGNTAGPVPVTISNIGGLDLIVTGISTPAGNFSITHPAVPITISAGGSVIVNASFAPLSSGPHSSSFVITSNALGTPTVTVSLLGNGIIPPPNDLCDNAILIGCGASVNGTTVLATFDNVGTCGTSNTSPGVWYKTIGTGSPITVSTCTAASYDTKLSVFSGTCAAKVCVGGNDDAAGCGLRSQVTFNSVAGTTYYILVHGFATAVGTFTLTTSQCPALISVTPSPLTINVPFNGTGSGTLNVANTAGTGGADLNWVITNTGPTSISGSANSYGIAAPQTVLFQVTDVTITALRAVHVPAAIWRGVETLLGQPASNKEDFVTMVVNVLGAENTNSFYQLIMENTIQFYEEVKGQPLVDQSAAGGPDLFGYSFIDSDAPGGPTFNWTDITGTGTPVVLGDDQGVLIPLPFNFSFYGSNKTQVTISSNGYLTFGSNGTTFTNTNIPNTGSPNDIICPFWDDLFPPGGGTIHYKSSATQFIVQYTNIKGFSDNLPKTFQVILNADGSILYQYLTMTGTLNSATLGIENATGTIGLQVINNAAYIHNNLAVLITLPPPCTWITSIIPSSGTTVAGATTPVAVNVNATGLVCGVYNCFVKVLSNASNTPSVTVPVILRVGPQTCSITSIPSNNTYTGGIPTNLYLGYGPQSTTLQVNVDACGAPYTYLWSGGTLSNYNTANPVFTATTAGTFTFTVQVTNAYGFNTTCTITICVRDIRVPGSNGKVYICHAPPGNPGNANTLSISTNAVPSHLLSHPGDKLGACNMAACGSTAPSMASLKVEELKVEGLKVSAFPNPSTQSFELYVQSNSVETVQLKVVDVTGRVVYSARGTANRIYQFGEGLVAGLYIAEISQGDITSKVKLIKQ